MSRKKVNFVPFVQKKRDNFTVQKKSRIVGNLAGINVYFNQNTCFTFLLSGFLVFYSYFFLSMVHCWPALPLSWKFHYFWRNFLKPCISWMVQAHKPFFFLSSDFVHGYGRGNLTVQPPRREAVIPCNFFL